MACQCLLCSVFPLPYGHCEPSDSGIDSIARGGRPPLGSEASTALRTLSDTRPAAHNHLAHALPNTHYGDLFGHFFGQCHSSERNCPGRTGTSDTFGRFSATLDTSPAAHNHRMDTLAPARAGQFRTLLRSFIDSYQQPVWYCVSDTFGQIIIPALVCTGSAGVQVDITGRWADLCECCAGAPAPSGPTVNAGCERGRLPGGGLRVTRGLSPGYRPEPGSGTTPAGTASSPTQLSSSLIAAGGSRSCWSTRCGRSSSGRWPKSY